MKVQYSNEVKVAIKEYKDSLSQYPISKERKSLKIRQLRLYLKKTIKEICQTSSAESFPLCNYRDLGQTFNQNNEPQNPFLRKTTFADESGTQWSISFILINNNQTVLIYCLRQSRFVVKENLVYNKVHTLLKECLSKRVLINESKRPIVRLTESELHKMVATITEQIINEEYKEIGSQKYTLNNGIESKSIVSLQNKGGKQKFHIGEDDGCYVLYGEDLKTGKSEPTSYIFPELFDALKKLPKLPRI